MVSYQIDHSTTYSYEFPVAVSHHSAHLKPLSTSRQQCRHFKLEIRPTTADLSERVDFFGNTMHLFSIQQNHPELVVDAHSEVSVVAPEIPIIEMTPTCDDVRSMLQEPRIEQYLSALQFSYASPFVPVSEELAAYAEPFLAPDKPYLQGALELASHIYNTCTFDPKATDVSTPVSAVLELKRGVCQDFAHLMLASLRSHKLPAAYVSGYILTHPPEGQERLVGADASHAWVSIFIPSYGWVEIDPTNNKICTDEHVTVAQGRDFNDVSMVRGAVTGGGEHTLNIEVTMSPISPPDLSQIKRQ